MQKGFSAVFILIGVLILVGVAGGAYYLGQKNVQQPKSQETIVDLKEEVSPTSKIDETADWKTYTDMRQGYSIKYPQTWHLFPNIVGGTVLGYDGTILNSAVKLEPHGEILAEEGEAGISINVVGTDKKPSESLLKYSKRKFSSPDTGGNNYFETVLGVNPAIKYVRTQEEPDPGQVIYMVSNDIFVYQINTSIHNQKYSQVVNQILSTLKFLDQTNPEAGFIDFNGRRLTIKVVAEGEYCEGRISATQTTYQKCNAGLKCEQPLGSAADAPGTCVKE